LTFRNAGKGSLLYCRLSTIVRRRAVQDILVLVDGSDASAARLALCLRLADSLDAAIHGLHVQPPADIGLSSRPSHIAEATEALERQLSADTNHARALFHSTMSASRRPFTWRELSGDIAKRVCEEARYADLVVVGQFDWQTPVERHPLPAAHSIALGAGRPILVTPDVIDAARPMSTAFVAWDGSRESVRAVHDALPLLRLASSVVLAVAAPLPADVSAERLADHLRREGVVGLTVRAVDRDGSEAGALLSALRAGEFDLAVFGAYSHPRWLEFLAGGTTQTLLSESQTPMLISH
jgi:nucleotide-binding universal stress UspA family protein